MMTRIGDRSIDGDHGLQVDKLLANAKYFGLGCLFGIWFKLMELCVDFLLCDWKDVICEELGIEYELDG